MPYVLGIDVGATHTTAALCDADGVSILPLDLTAGPVDSVLYLADDDTVLVGRDALARAQTEPDRVARNFVDRIGDAVAPLLGGRPCPAEMLTAALINWVVDRAIEAEGIEPDRIVVTHPAGWGAYRRGLLDAALRSADLPGVLLLPRPIAAAESHAAAHPMTEGDAVAVYHLGGRSLSCAVARLGPRGFGLLAGFTTGEHGAGGRFDDLLAAHVLGEVGVAPADLDPADEETRAALGDLRAACRAAKETLSGAAEAIVPTPLLGPPSSVLVGRARFEELIGPDVARTVEELTRVIRGAGGVSAVCLTGGSARIPLVAELVRAAGQVVVDREPETAVARGAAVAGRRVGSVAMAPARVPEQRDDRDDLDDFGTVDPDAPTQPPRPPVELAPLDVPVRGARRWKVARRRAG
jgi:molecular chaperone DnaK (HSP70)